MSFDSFGLHATVMRGVVEAGYSVPTPIQREAIPVVMGGRDLLGLAQTGTGKTAAFVLPILHRLVSMPPAADKGRRSIRALILAPTRELAEQIYQAVLALGARTLVKAAVVYGGVSKVRQLEAIRRRPDILVACPGRLLDHLSERAVDLSGVTTLVLDEADRMCDMGFLPDIRRVLALLPADRQTLFFSATMPTEIRGLSAEILKRPATVEVDRIAPATTVTHALYPVAEGAKAELLFALVERTATARVLVFTRTKHRAKSLARKLEKAGHRVAALQGNMSQNRRQDAMDGFRAGRYDILVATDIAARGIDVSEISHVINYDMPDTVDAYTHRIGRTGRAERDGDAFTLATQEDAEMVRLIERALGYPLERKRLSGFDYGAFDPTAKPAARANASSVGLARPSGSRRFGGRGRTQAFRAQAGRRSA